MRRNTRQGGFSLVGLAVSIAVIAVALLGTTAAITTGASLGQSTTRRQTAARAVASIMEEVRSTDFVDLVTDFDKTSHEIAHLQDGGGRATAAVNVDEVNNGSTRWKVYRVTVNVRFEGSNGSTDEFPVVTYVSDRTTGSALSGAPTVGGDGGTGDPTAGDPNGDPTAGDPNGDPTAGDPNGDPTAGDPYPDPTGYPTGGEALTGGSDPTAGDPGTTDPGTSSPGNSGDAPGQSKKKKK